MSELKELQKSFKALEKLVLGFDDDLYGAMVRVKVLEREIESMKERA